MEFIILLDITTKEVYIPWTHAGLFKAGSQNMGLKGPSEYFDTNPKT